MAEKSTWWTTGATGDGATEYTQDEVIRIWRQQWVGDNALEGVHKNYLNELEVTGTVTQVSVDTGAAVVYGFPYWNTAAVNVAIPTPASNTRIDVIVLRANWTAQTVRITRIAGTEGAAAPSISQSAGTTWDIKIAEASITTGGVITVTDYRVFLHANIAVDENMLDNAALGDGLDGGDGTVLSVDVSDFAGTNLEDDGSNNLRIAATAAGDGLQGGAASPLAADVSDFAGTGLEDDGAENLRIAASAAGDGLAGGAGSALSVNVDDSTIEINADTLRVKDEGIGAAKITNRTRRFFTPVVNPQNDTDQTWWAAGFDLDTGSGLIETPDNKFSIGNGIAIVPADFVSDLVCYGLFAWDFGASGNAYLKVVMNVGRAPGAIQAVGQYVSGWTAQAAGGTDTYTKFGPATCTGSPLAGDILLCSLQRDALHASDTLNSELCHFVGFIFEYTADS